MTPVLRGSSLWDAMFRHLPAGIIVLLPVTGEDGRLRDLEILGLNGPASKILGRNEAELLGSRLGTLAAAFRESAFMTRCQRVLQQDQAAEFEQMLPAVREDGSRTADWYMLSVLPSAGRLLIVLNSITRRKTALMEAVRLLGVDDLTGIGNRRLLKSQFWRRRQAGAGMSLVYFDLDGFKRVNDEHGHEKGDEVLKIVAQRLQNNLRPDEAVARLGGDEYAVLLDTSDLQAATSVARRLADALTRPISVGTVTVQVGASVGVSVYPEDGENFEALLSAADMRMYSVKQARRLAAGAEPDADRTRMR